MRTSHRFRAACAVLATGLCGFAPTIHAGDTARAGIEIRGDVTAKDLGVPIYPGAVPRKDKDDDRSALTVAAWGGDSLFRIAVVKLTSPAPIDRIARFYRDALGRFGDVLDCSRTEPMPSRDEVLTCDRNDVRGDALVYKVGVPTHQHVVKMKSAGDGVQIDVVRVDAGR